MVAERRTPDIPNRLELHVLVRPKDLQLRCRESGVEHTKAAASRPPSAQEKWALFIGRQDGELQEPRICSSGN